MTHTPARPPGQESVVDRLAQSRYDLEALIELYQLTCGCAWSYARRYANKTDARDIVIRAYLNAWEAPATLQDPTISLQLQICLLVHLEIINRGLTHPRTRQRRRRATRHYNRQWNLLTK